MFALGSTFSSVHLIRYLVRLVTYHERIRSIGQNVDRSTHPRACDLQSHSPSSQCLLFGAASSLTVELW